MSENHPTTLRVYTFNTLVLKLNMEINFVSQKLSVEGNIVLSNKHKGNIDL